MSTGAHPNFSPLLHTVSQTVAFPHGYTLLIFGTTMITTHVHGAPWTYRSSLRLRFRGDRGLMDRWERPPIRSVLPLGGTGTLA